MSRVGVAVSLLKAGHTHEFVAKHTRLSVTEVDMLAREQDAAIAAGQVAAKQPARKRTPKPRRPLLNTARSEAIREAVAKTAPTLDDRPARKNPGRPSRAGDKRPRWTAGDDGQLREMVMAGFSHAEIAVAIGRSITSVTQRASVIGARLPPGARSKVLSAMMKARHHLKAGDHLTALDIIETTLKETTP